MKRSGKSANMYVMFGLLAVLFLSLGYLSMQSEREGLNEMPPTAGATPPTIMPGMTTEDIEKAKKEREINASVK